MQIADDGNIPVQLGFVRRMFRESRCIQQLKQIVFTTLFNIYCRNEEIDEIRKMNHCDKTD